MPPVECPACHGREIYEIAKVSFEDHSSSNMVLDFALFAHYGPSGEMGWMGEKNKRTSIPVSARVCGECGHATLFASDLTRLKQFAAQGLIRKLS
ncbi:MAG: hypothetical protein SFX73_02050 [Kofleriaceae bacterium]|nr:hypothetical protein [Kofleriaceae bacterium]